MMDFEKQVGRLTEATTGRSWSAQECEQQVAIRSQAYVSSGFKAGERVLIHFGNCLEFFAELLAIWRLGGCAIPVDARLTVFEVEKLVQAARARFSVINDSTDTNRLSALEEGVVLHTDQAKAVLTNPDSGLRSGHWPVLDDDALILFTSGSTGQPKGVVHTHRSLLARWSALRQSIGTRAYQKTLCVLPTHFGHGLICNCLFPWLSGCDLVIAPPFESRLVMKLGSLIDEFEISFMSSVPSVWNLALKTSPSPEKATLKRIHIGSAPLSENLWKQVQSWSGTQEVFNTYGITETGSWVAGTTGGEVVPESGLIGEGWGAEIRVLDGEGQDCEAEQTGMVWLHTPALMKGYFQRDDLTQAAVQHGWFNTGDIGMLDQRGRLYLRGRERDEINKGGMKVFPADIDEVVEQFSETRDVCSFALPDEFYGENVGLAVVLANESNGTLQSLHAWIQDHLAEHKQPVQWFVLDEIPRTSRGKINREQVREACLEQQPVNLHAVLSGPAE